MLPPSTAATLHTVLHLQAMLGAFVDANAAVSSLSVFGGNAAITPSSQYLLSTSSSSRENGDTSPTMNTPMLSASCAGKSALRRVLARP